MKQKKREQEVKEKVVNFEKLGEAKTDIEDLKAIRRYIG
jgi:hypothetical protein